MRPLPTQLTNSALQGLRRSSRGLLLASWLLVLPSSLFAASAPQERWPHLAELQEILGQPEEQQALQQLRALGPSATPAVWALLSGQAFVDDDSPSPQAHDLLQRGVAAWKPDPVVTELQAVISESTPLSERLAGLKLLAWTDCHASFTAMIDVLEGLDPLQARSSWVSVALDQHFTPMLASQPVRFKLLAERLPTLPRELLPLVIDTLAPLPRPEVLELFSRLSRKDRGLARQVLSKLASHDYLVADPMGYGLLSLAREGLNHSDAAMRRMAASAVGRLGDIQSFETLIQLLGDEDIGTRRVALDSLQGLSGLKRHWDQSQWLSWYQDERSWMEASQGRQGDLGSANLFLAKNAARELAAHTFFAEEALQQLRLVLRHGDPGVRQIGCAALSDVHHPDAISLLIEAMGDHDHGVHGAAHRALEQATGLDLGDEARDWNSWWRSL